MSNRSQSGEPAIPQPTRPHMPDYGISAKPEGMLSWQWVDEQMAKSRSYWIASVRPDGRPHSAPVWGIWVDGAFYTYTGRMSRKARNVAASPEVVVHLESGDDVVILEGRFEEVNDKALRDRLADIYVKKYPPYRPGDSPGDVCWVLKTRQVMAWKEQDFMNTPTRWQFE